MRDFLDGTSNSLLVGELLIGHPHIQTNSALRDTPDAVTQFSNGCEATNYSGTGTNERAIGNAWFRGYFPWESAFTSLVTPNSNLPSCASNTGDIMVGSRSLHPGGVQTAMGDGSVRFFTESIEWETWVFLGGIKDGMPVQMPD